MARIVITSESLEEGEKTRVYVKCPDGEPSFEEWMTSTEFLISLVARKSSAGFERAMELLMEGAMTYRRVE